MKKNLYLWWALRMFSVAVSLAPPLRIKLSALKLTVNYFSQLSFVHNCPHQLIFKDLVYYFAKSS